MPQTPPNPADRVCGNCYWCWPFLVYPHLCHEPGSRYHDQPVKPDTPGCARHEHKPEKNAMRALKLDGKSEANYQALDNTIPPLLAFEVKGHRCGGCLHFHPAPFVNSAGHTVAPCPNAGELRLSHDAPPANCFASVLNPITLQ